MLDLFKGRKRKELNEAFETTEGVMAGGTKGISTQNRSTMSADMPYSSNNGFPMNGNNGDALLSPYNSKGQLYQVSSISYLWSNCSVVSQIIDMPVKLMSDRDKKITVTTNGDRQFNNSLVHTLENSLYRSDTIKRMNEAISSSRFYGACLVFVAPENPNNISKPITEEEIQQSGGLKLNLITRFYNPQLLAGSTYPTQQISGITNIPVSYATVSTNFTVRTESDPTRQNYGSITSVSVGGQDVHKSRYFVVYNPNNDINKGMFWGVGELYKPLYYLYDLINLQVLLETKSHQTALMTYKNSSSNGPLTSQMFSLLKTLASGRSVLIKADEGIKTLDVNGHDKLLDLNINWTLNRIAEFVDIPRSMLYMEPINTRAPAGDNDFKIQVTSYQNIYNTYLPFIQWVHDMAARFAWKKYSPEEREYFIDNMRVEFSAYDWEREQKKAAKQQIQLQNIITVGNNSGDYESTMRNINSLELDIMPYPLTKYSPTDAEKLIKTPDIQDLNPSGNTNTSNGV